jgi:hypothetical protein
MFVSQNFIFGFDCLIDDFFQCAVWRTGDWKFQIRLCKQPGHAFTLLFVQSHHQTSVNQPIISDGSLIAVDFFGFSDSETVSQMHKQ